MRQFEVGKTYHMRSPGMSDCIWKYKVLSRTDKTVTLKDCDTGKTQRCRINERISQYNDAETVLPLGNYSMCPVLDATKVA